MPLSTSERTLADILRGNQPNVQAACVADLFECALSHRVDLLLASAIVKDSSFLPKVARPPLRARLRSAAAADLARQADLARVLRAIAAEVAPAILIKGAALAHLYPATFLRDRSDIDLVVHPDDRRGAELALERAGYVRAAESVGTLNSFQSHWARAGRSAPVLFIDLHWRLFNAEPFAEVLTVAEIQRDSTRFPDIESARMPSLEHALLIAAVHRVAHHYDSPSLLWLYDIDLLARALGADRLARVAALAVERGMGLVVERGLARAIEAFDTPVPASVRQQLAGAAAVPSVALFLKGSPREVDVLRANLSAMTSWRLRLRLVREHLFPPLAYMRASYAQMPRVLLPLAYLHRIVRGAPKWFRGTA